MKEEMEDKYKICQLGLSKYNNRTFIERYTILNNLGLETVAELSTITKLLNKSFVAGFQKGYSINEGRRSKGGSNPDQPSTVRPKPPKGQDCKIK